MKLSTIKTSILALSLTFTSLAIAAPDGGPVGRAINTPVAGPNPVVNAHTPVVGPNPVVVDDATTPTVVYDTTRPPLPPVCQNMTPTDCDTMLQQMHQQMAQQWQQMTPAQKQMQQQQMQQAWQTMSPQEKQMLKEKMVQKWQSMGPDDQQDVLQQMQTTQSSTPSTNGIPDSSTQIIEKWRTLTPQQQQQILQKMQAVQNQLPDPTPGTTNATAATSD